MALPVSDSFVAGAGVLADPPWTNTETSSASYNGSGGVDVGGTGDNDAFWNADVFPDDQQTSITLQTSFSADDTQFFGLFVRADSQPEATMTGYYFFSDGGSDTALASFTSGTFTELDRDNTITGGPGDVFTLSAVGTDIVVQKNGVAVLSASNAFISSGQPGFQITCQAGPGVVALGPWTADAASGGGPGGGTHVTTGRGSVAIDSPAWLSTAITGRPAHLGNGPAEPVNYLHMGSLSWGTANGVMNRYVVTRDLDLVELPPGMTELHYEWADGITATITELATP